ncbi:VOC family protein [Streptomyces sp. RFCAC02]|uniref:VOC family protein n=1 Tax=Streptomyces sp. RFCAC02 TaxID=2499143 RepID=UPI001021E037|nr:VOC family protein [Streptomyces sp. RFCAC02]
MSLARFSVTVLDCPDPRALAAFYSDVLGWPIDEEHSDDGWVEIRGGAPAERFAFQLSEGYRPPEWPGTEHPQQMHIDLDVPESRLDEAERDVLTLGARLLQGDDGGQRGFRVYADPAGHPFCLCRVRD